MNIRITTLCLVAILQLQASDSIAHSRKSKTDCEKTRQKIAKIESRMRHGYTASQGVKLDDKLRRLRKLRAKYCR